MKITESKLKEFIKEELESLLEVGEDPPLGPSPGAVSSKDTSSAGDGVGGGETDVTKMKPVTAAVLKKIKANAALNTALERVKKDPIGSQQIVAHFARVLGVDLGKDISKLKDQSKRIATQPGALKETGFTKR